MRRRLATFVALLAVASGGACGNDETTTATTATTRTTSAPTTVPTTSTTAGDSPAGALETAVWPYPSGRRFNDPVAAARSFAVDYVGFTDGEIIVGAFRAGDSRSGEVPVRPYDKGPETTVLVREANGSWWVIGSNTANIEVKRPTALESISSPVRLQGTSTAFEATVNVFIRQDGDMAKLGEGYVMGGANGERAPFDSELAFRRATAPRGAVVFLTYSARDGHVWEASVVRVQFATP